MKDKVIEWRKQADAYAVSQTSDLYELGLIADERFAQLARADKQEQCAKVCAARDMGDGSREDQEARRCESAIRALKD